MFVDGHLDLAYLAVLGRDLRVPCAPGTGGCVSLPALRAAGIDLVFGTIFTEPGAAAAFGYASSDDLDAAEAAGRRQLDVYEQLEREGEIAIVRTARDLDAGGPRPRVVLLMEGADPIRGPEAVGEWFARGLRLVGLTWAMGTRYAGGNASGGDLTARGIDLVRALDDAGIVHDVSHLSDAAFDGLLATARGPLVATHSNCRALLDANERHLRDDQVRALAAREGIVGLNLYTAFLAADRRATVADCVAHVQRMADLMGHRRGVALGSDMDGGFGAERLPEGLDHPAKLPALAGALRGAGWSDANVAGFRADNWLRFLRGSLPGG